MIESLNRELSEMHFGHSCRSDKHLTHHHVWYFSPFINISNVVLQTNLEKPFSIHYITTNIPSVFWEIFFVGKALPCALKINRNCII